MSLGIVVKGSEGIVLAADSRLTLTATLNQPNAAANVQVQLPVNFDNATKLLTFAKPNNWIGAVTFGDAAIGTNASDLRTAQSFVPEFEVGLPEERLSVADFSQRLSDFYLQQWQAKMPANHPGTGMTFVVAGFNESEPYGSVYEFVIPNKPAPTQISENSFGVTYGGQNELAAKIIQGYDPRIIDIAKNVGGMNIHKLDEFKKALAQLQLTIPYQVLPLQDCIDLAVFLIKTTTTAQNLSIGIRGVGGAIDVAVITQREGLRIIQRKELVAEGIK